MERLLEAYADERMYEELYPERLFEEYSLYLVPLVNPDGVDLVNGLLTEGFYYRRAVHCVQIPGYSVSGRMEGKYPGCGSESAVSGRMGYGKENKI